MKKAELKAGVAYFVSTRGNYGWGYRDSYYEIHDQNKRFRYYVLMGNDGNPITAYNNPNQIYMTPCATYGLDCPTHRPKEGSTYIACYRTDYRLMDIREEYWAVIKRLHERRIKERNSKDIRAERLRRIAKREAEAKAKPIEEEFYRVLSQVCKERMTSWDKLGGFNLEQMQAVTNALKSGMPSVQAVA